MNDKTQKICDAGRLCDICKFRVQCYKEDWPHSDKYPPCAIQMPADWVDDTLVDKVYNAIIEGGI